jgi:hypothetical protein
MLKLVLMQLRHLLIGRVEFPNEQRKQQFAQLISLREPAATDVIEFMDSVLFTSECTSKQIQQNAYYCGYDCDTMVSNVFAYGPDGKVFFCAINYPGSWGVGTLASRFLTHIINRIGN